MLLNWKKNKGKIRFAIVGFIIVFCFALQKMSAINGSPIFSEQNIKFVSIGTALMIVLVFFLTFIANAYDSWKSKKKQENKENHTE
jgi:hypothetical protein